MRQFNCEDNATYTPGQEKITPTGTIEITENGTYDVAQYANADVNVSGGGGGGDESLKLLIDRSIQKFVVPSGVFSIGQYAFNRCTRLTNITVSNDVRYIEAYAFGGCNSLSNFVASGVKEIGRSCFSECSTLTSVDLPSSLTSIEDYAFSGCGRLSTIIVRAINPPTIRQNTFLNVPSTANIYVPAESVEAYKAASYWSSRAAYIQAISE